MIPQTEVTAPASIASVPPFIVISALIDACMIKNAIAADSAATSFSFFAIPIATPMANRIGKLANTTFPASLITPNTAANIVPGPRIRISPYVSSMVSLVNELPIPSSSPATGRIAIGSINDRPTRCNIPNILSFI